MRAWHFVWNLTVLIGCGVVVFGLHRSAWWFLLALALMFYPSDDECECNR